MQVAMGGRSGILHRECVFASVRDARVRRRREVLVGRRLAAPRVGDTEGPLQCAARVLLVAGRRPVHVGLEVRPHAQGDLGLHVHVVGALGVVLDGVATLELLERDLPARVLLLLAERLVQEAVQPAVRDEVLVAGVGLRRRSGGYQCAQRQGCGCRADGDHTTHSGAHGAHVSPQVLDGCA